MKNIVLNKAADAVVRRRERKKRAKYVKDGKYIDGSVQEYIPVKTIEDGIVITTDGRYVAIMEFTPIDFRRKSRGEQESICKGFARLFRNGPVKMEIKIMTDRYSPSAFLKNIRARNAREQDEERIRSIEDYENQIYLQAENASIVKRFFIIIEYEAVDGKKSYDRNEVIEIMKDQKERIAHQLKASGNMMVSMGSDNMTVGEILYYMFNRKTCRRESFQDRFERMTKDYDEYSSMTGIQKKAEVVDAIAPKGLYFDSAKYVYQDGEYYTYLGIKSEGWCRIVPYGWLETLNQGSCAIDTTVLFSRLKKEIAKKFIEKTNSIRKQSIWEHTRHNKLDKAEKEKIKYENNAFIITAMNNGDDLYNVDIILTLRAESPKMLQKLKTAVIRAYNAVIEFEDSWMCNEEYYRATMPFLQTPKMLSRLHKNLVSTEIGSMYPFISFELNDTDGYLLGYDKDSLALVIINNFASIYNNGHMLLIGMSGVGKSFTEKLIAGRCSLNGMRVTCICPAKGFEYKPLCTAYGGTYVDLIPSSKSCLNPMEVRPEGEMRKDLTLEDEDIQKAKASLLAKKLSTLVVWFKLNLYGKGHTDAVMTSRETSRMTALLTCLYGKFGITGDNDSVWAPDGKLKTMPIIEDWYNMLQEDAELEKFAYVLEPYVTGICSNLNGQTNVDLSKPVTIYNVDGEIIPEEYFSAYMFLAFSNSYERIKENIYVRDVLILDEVWQMMKVKECAEQVRDAIKLMRSYYGACLIATQELEDFFGKSGEFGRSVVNNTNFKFFMSMDEEALNIVKEHYKFTEEDEKTILEFGKGEGLLIAGANKVRIKVHIEATEREHELYNTDGNKR